MNLFDFLYRGATVYAAHKGRIAQKPNAMQALIAIALGATAYVKKEQFK